jgi:hypothetical protein
MGWHYLQKQEGQHSHSETSVPQYREAFMRLIGVN